MTLSQRQTKLIQGGAEVLITELKLSHEEVLEIISTEIRKELMKQQITMEALNHRQRSERTTFIRHVVHGVHERLTQKNLWTEVELERTIRKFMEVLHESWGSESPS